MRLLCCEQNPLKDVAINMSCLGGAGYSKFSFYNDEYFGPGFAFYTSCDLSIAESMCASMSLTAIPFNKFGDIKILDYKNNLSVGQSTFSHVNVKSNIGMSALSNDKSILSFLVSIGFIMNDLNIQTITSSDVTMLSTAPYFGVGFDLLYYVNSNIFVFLNCAIHKTVRGFFDYWRIFDDISKEYKLSVKKQSSFIYYLNFLIAQEVLESGYAWTLGFNINQNKSGESDNVDNNISMLSGLADIQYTFLNFSVFFGIINSVGFYSV